MSRNSRNVTVSLGDLIAAAYAAAEIVSEDPRAAAGIAARTVGRRLARAHRLDVARRLRMRGVVATETRAVHARAA